jgi:hypothetical protein
MLDIVIGSIFDSKEKYLIHQTNCITNRSAHLAKTVFEHYPYADVYTARKQPDHPGTIIIRGNGEDQRFVIALLGQYYPGKSKFPDSDNNIDGVKIRQNYFYKALNMVAKIPNLESVALPVGIGCGAAGGNWDHYLGTIVNFSKFIYKKQGARVVLYDYKL